MSDADFSLFTSLRYDVQLRQVPGKDMQFAGWNYQNESPFYMLDFHRDRMLKAATHWKWERAIESLTGDEAFRTLAKLSQDFVGPSETKPLRFKILVSREGAISFERFDTPTTTLGNLLPERLLAPGELPGSNDPQDTACYTLLVDDVPLARSEFTHYKTTRRAMYDAARLRASIGPRDTFKEVLIINQADRTVMEGSTTTPYFWRDGKWVTPPVSADFSWDEGSGGQDGTSRRWALERGLVVEQAVPLDSLIEGEDCWISNGVRGFQKAKVSLKN